VQNSVTKVVHVLYCIVGYIRSIERLLSDCSLPPPPFLDTSCPDPRRGHLPLAGARMVLVTRQMKRAPPEFMFFGLGRGPEISMLCNGATILVRNKIAKVCCDRLYL